MVCTGKRRVSERALFRDQPGGIVHWSYVSPLGVNPGAAGILSRLKNCKTKRRQNEPEFITGIRQPNSPPVAGRDHIQGHYAPIACLSTVTSNAPFAAKFTGNQRDSAANGR